MTFWNKEFLKIQTEIFVDKIENKGLREMRHLSASGGKTAEWRAAAEALSP